MRSLEQTYLENRWISYIPSHRNKSPSLSHQHHFHVIQTVSPPCSYRCSTEKVTALHSKACKNTCMLAVCWWHLRLCALSARKMTKPEFIGLPLGNQSLKVFPMKSQNDEIPMPTEFSSKAVSQPSCPSSDSQTFLQTIGWTMLVVLWTTDLGTCNMAQGVHQYSTINITGIFSFIHSLFTGGEGRERGKKHPSVACLQVSPDWELNFFLSGMTSNQLSHIGLGTSIFSLY